MSRQETIALQVSQGGAWFEGQTYDIGARVTIVDPAVREQLGAASGQVVGYDPSGPLPGESFLRVLVQPDLPTPRIDAVPPAAIEPEGSSERGGVARSLLMGLEMTMRPERFRALLEWLSGPTCTAMLEDPKLSRRRIRLGELYLPGLLLPDLVLQATERLRQ
ncbi:MAG: hypothetical protein HC822_14325 [Oscillochloris sp.]|nr:hypothetical protein [Oscillochloris sp.]